MKGVQECQQEWEDFTLGAGVLAGQNLLPS